MRSNEGAPFPDDLFAQTFLEVEERFGAVSTETQVVRGYWRHNGAHYRDDLIRFFVDVDDTPEARQFFVEFKETLKARFQQVDIWMTSYPIEIH